MYAQPARGGILCGRCRGDGRSYVISRGTLDRLMALQQTSFDASDAIDFWDMTNRQDWHVCELSQAGISSRAYTPGPYSNREDLLYAFDRMIVRLHENG